MSDMRGILGINHLRPFAPRAESKEGDCRSGCHSPEELFPLVNSARWERARSGRAGCKACLSCRSCKTTPPFWMPARDGRSSRPTILSTGTIAIPCSARNDNALPG